MNDLFVELDDRPKNLGRIWTALKEVDSTNAEILRQVRKGVNEGFVVVADCQKKGKGRLGRSWKQKPGADLAFSVLLTPKITNEDLNAMPLIASLAAARGLIKLGFDAKIRWPNDILIGGKKVAGILVENKTVQRNRNVVLGFGVNVKSTVEDFPKEIAEKATSLAMVSGNPDSLPGRSQIAIAILKSLEEIYPFPFGRGFSKLIPEYSALWIDKDRPVKVETKIETIEGIAVGVTAGGSLMLKVGEEGKSINVSEGDLKTLIA